MVSTGGTTHYNDTFGICAYGSGARVLNNDVIETKEQPAGGAYGIYLYSASGTVAENNRIGNSSLGAGTSYSIRVSGPTSTNVLVSNNRMTTMNFGVYYPAGSTGKYRDNLTSGVTTAYTGGTDAGGNN